MTVGISSNISSKLSPLSLTLKIQMTPKTHHTQNTNIHSTICLKVFILRTPTKLIAIN